MGVGGARWRQPWDSLGGADLTGVPAGVVQSQQQRHETLQHQLPEGAAEPHPEPAPAAPHQRPEEPDRRGADRVPNLHRRARSGRSQQGEGVRTAAVWGRDLGARSGAWLGNPGRAWGGGGDGGRGGAGPEGGAGPGSRRPEAVGGAVPAQRSGAAPAPAAASGPSAAPPVRRPRAARHPRLARPGARAAACSRDAPAGTGTRGRPLADPAQTPPSRAPHLPAVQRQVAEAQQAQPAHGGLGVALPSAEPLQDDLLPQKPCGGPALQ